MGGRGFKPRLDQHSGSLNREFTQPQRRRQQERHKSAYLTMKNNRFARFARVFFHFWTFRRHSRSFHDMKRPVLQLCGRRENMMTNVQFYLLTSEVLVAI